MLLHKIKLDNHTVYRTSRSTEPLSVSGTFSHTEKQYNGRVKITDETDKVYWIRALDLYALTNLEEDIDIASDTNATLDEDDVESSAVEPLYHTVKRGDTLQSVAAQYGVAIDSISSRYISLAVGQRIRIR